MTKPRHESQKNGLIQTKIFPLKAGQQFVFRSRLVDQIVESLNLAQVVTIVGAAGSGKSILMSQLFGKLQKKRSTCWLNFDDSDDDLNSFLLYFTSALQEIDADLGKRAADMIDYELADNIDHAFQSLCEDISSVTNDIAIFLDDFQFIKDPTLLLGMQKFIGALPRNVLLIITSRSQIDVGLNKRRIDGSLKEVGQLDLNFSTDETMQLMSDMHDVSLETVDMETLIESTEGWAAGLQLAGLALKNSAGNKREVIQGFSGRDRDLSTYLMETVFKQQTDQVREFLLNTAPLSRLNAELCSAVTGIADSNHILEHLHTENMFLVPLDRNHEWFRYHHLFSEFLVQQLNRSAECAFERIAQKASDWFSERGLNTEAIKYLLAAGMHDRAAKLISVEGGKVAQVEGDHQTILSWMRLLPEKYRELYPQIGLNYAWTLLFTRSAHRSEEIADEVRSELELGRQSKWQLTEEDLQNLKCITDVIKAISYNARDKTSEASKLLEKSLKHWAEADATQLSALHSSLAYTCVVSLDFEKGFRAAEKARVLSLQSEAAYLSVWADWVSAVLCIEKGLFDEADKFLHLGQDDAGKLGRNLSHGRAMIALVKAELFCDRGNMEAAASELNKSAWFGTYFAPLEPLLMAYRTQARILFSQSRGLEALSLLQEGQELGLVSDLPRLSVGLAAEEIKLHLRKNALDDAIAVSEKWGFKSEAADPDLSDKREMPVSLHQEIKARILIAKEKYGNAISVLNGLITRAMAKQRGRHLVELRVLKAISLWRSDRELEAMRELAIATAAAAPQDFRSPFLDATDGLADILEAMRKQRATEDMDSLKDVIKFERSLFSSVSGTPLDQSTAIEEESDQWLLDPLTRREIQIVDLLSKGLSNKQVADTLFVTTPTVKWHLNNVFQKFNLRNRTAVVSKARKLKIIP